MLTDAAFNEITRDIISAGIEVHRALGPGLLESAYTPCLQHELAIRKRRFATERSVPIVYKGIALDTRYRIDLIVEDTALHAREQTVVLPNMGAGAVRCHM